MHLTLFIFYGLLTYMALEFFRHGLRFSSNRSYVRGVFCFVMGLVVLVGPVLPFSPYMDEDNHDSGWRFLGLYLVVFVPVVGLYLIACLVRLAVDRRGGS